jgi:hypothetical protein
VRLINLASDRVAVMFSGEDCVMKKLVAIVVGSLALVVGQPLIAQHWSEAVAQIPFPAGQFSSSSQGYFGVCTHNAVSPEACSTSGAIIVAFTAVANGSNTFDSAGNGCGVEMEVDTLPLAPLYLAAPPPGYPPAPAFVDPVVHVASKVIDYDTATGIGDDSFNAFIGGTCKGASFDSSGATPVAEGMGHFVVTRGGARIDSFITKRVVYVSSANHANTVGDFSFSGTQLRQTAQNEQ